MKSSLHLPLLGLIALGAAGLTGCLSLQPVADPVRYFRLEPLAESVESGPPPAAPLAVGIAQVQIPAYLQSRALAVIKTEAPHEISYHTYLQWSEPLDGAVTEVLGANLAAQLQTSRIFTHGWYTQQVDYELYVELERFDLDEQGQVRLEARWRITRPGGREVVRFGHAIITHTAAPPLQHPEQAVAGLSQALAELSRRVADDLRKLNASKPTAAR